MAPSGVVERVRELVEAMPCDRARYAPDVMEWAEEPSLCIHCQLLEALGEEEMT